MIDDGPSRQLMRFRASWERQDARRRRHQPRIRLGARSHRRSGNQGGNLPSRKPLKTRETRKFSQRSATLSRGRKDAPRGPGRSRRPFAAEVAGARSRRKFSLLQSFEKSENAEILRRHRGAPCLPNIDGNPRGRLPLRRCPIIVASTPPSLRAQRSNPGATARGPWIASSQGLLAMTVNGGVRVPRVDFLISGLRLTTASGASPRLRNSKAAQSRVCLDRRPDGDRRAIVDFLNRGVSVAVDRGARGLGGETEWPGNGAATV